MKNDSRWRTLALPSLSREPHWLPCRSLSLKPRGISNSICAVDGRYKHTLSKVFQGLLPEKRMRQGHQEPPFPARSVLP